MGQGFCTPLQPGPPALTEPKDFSSSSVLSHPDLERAGKALGSYLFEEERGDRGGQECSWAR